MITPRQKQVFDFIKSYLNKKGFAPSLEEIKKKLRLRSVSTAHFHVAKLHELGLLKKENNQPRSIDIYESEQMVQIPLLGTIAAGQPIEAIEDKEECIAVPKRKLLATTKDYYALRVKGQSMIEENISDGDIIIVKNQNTAKNGEKVVALLENSEVTLKKYYKEKSQIRLQPANKELKPILVKGEQLLIQGIVVDIVKTEVESETQKQNRNIEFYTELPINKIICGDAIQELKKFPDNSVDLIIADPPYGISRELNCKNQRLGSTAKLNFNFGTWDKFDKDWFNIAINKTKGWIMTFCAKKDTGIFWDILEKNGFVAIDVVVWQKPDPLPLNAKSRFLNAWEAIVIGKKNGATWNSTYSHNIIKVQAPKGKGRIHPTQKPVSLIKNLIELTTKKNDIVLDPFIGSGTTAVACIETNRNYIGIEISKEYYTLAKKRIRSSSQTLLSLPRKSISRLKA